MNIIVTGGAGFIGSHVCELIVSQGHDVVVIDDLSTGSIDNLKLIIDQINFVKKNIKDIEFSSFEDCDALIHLAAQVSVPLSISDFYHSSKANLLSSIKLIDFCSKSKIPFVYASSAAVYGGLEFADDQSDTVKLLSPYAADKYAMESYAEVASRNHGLSSFGLRLFNVYGPRQNPTNPYSGVISKFLADIFSGNDLTIFGGKQTRDFVYVLDVAKIILSAVQHCISEVSCERVNVLTGSSLSINELSDLLIKATKSQVGKRYSPMSVGDPLMSIGSTEKLQRFFGKEFSEMSMLEEGLLPTIEFVCKAMAK